MHGKIQAYPYLGYARGLTFLLPWLSNSPLLCPNAMPTMQAPGFTTTADERRAFLQKVFSAEVACPLVCFHARPCLLAMSPFVQLRPEIVCEALGDI